MTFGINNNGPSDAILTSDNALGVYGIIINNYVNCCNIQSRIAGGAKIKELDDSQVTAVVRGTTKNNVKFIKPRINKIDGKDRTLSTVTKSSRKIIKKKKQLSNQLTKSKQSAKSSDQKQTGCKPCAAARAAKSTGKIHQTISVVSEATKSRQSMVSEATKSSQKNVTKSTGKSCKSCSGNGAKQIKTQAASKTTISYIALRSVSLASNTTPSTTARTVDNFSKVKSSKSNRQSSSRIMNGRVNGRITNSLPCQPCNMSVTGCPVRQKCVKKVCEPDFSQPCWTQIAAGCDTSVFVDECNRLWTLGSLHEIRSNFNLLQNSELDKLLNGRSTKISFNGNLLNKSTHNGSPELTSSCPRPDNRNFSTSSCTSQRAMQISVDMNALSPDMCTSECGDANDTNSMCDFIMDLKQAQELSQISCKNTCEPCENIVTIFVDLENTCSSYVPATITIYNKKSVCGVIASPQFLETRIPFILETSISFDGYNYCIDGSMLCVDNVIVFTIGNGFGNIDIYLDIEKPGDLIITPQNFSKSSTLFQPSINTGVEMIMNMGSIMDPTELLNLKAVFTNKYAFYCKTFTNPSPFRLINTYLRPGDRVKLLQPNCLVTDIVTSAITADLPTVFDINRNILDIAVGRNNLSLLYSNKCTTQILAIGNNCYGQLGLNNFITPLCWQPVNKCYFTNESRTGAYDAPKLIAECPNNAVVRIFAGPTSTFYLTQDWSIYMSGEQSCLSNRHIVTRPNIVREIRASWKTKKLIITKNNIIALSANGYVFGLGNSDLGQLGTRDKFVDNFGKIKYYEIEEDEATEKNVVTSPTDMEFSEDTESHRFLQYDGTSSGAAVPKSSGRTEKRKYDWSKKFEGQSKISKADWAHSYKWPSSKNRK